MSTDEEKDDDEFFMLCKCEDKKKVVATCETCDEFLCTLCYFAHLRVKLTRNHQFKILSKIQQPKTAKRMKNKRTQTKRLKAKKLLVRPVTSRALATDKKCKQYTGLHLVYFNQLMKGLEGKFLSSYKMAPKGQLILKGLSGVFNSSKKMNEKVKKNT